MQNVKLKFYYFQFTILVITQYSHFWLRILILFAWHFLIDCNYVANFEVSVLILLHFEIEQIWCFKHVFYQFFSRSILMRNIFRVKHLLHDVFCHNLRILNQYTNIFDLIYTHHICDRVYYVHLYQTNTL